MASNRYDKHSRIALEHLSKDLATKVFVDAKSKDQASVDNLKISYSPSAVIKVKKAHQVGIVLKHANQYRIPVTARGAGSSTNRRCSSNTWRLGNRFIIIKRFF